MKNENAVIEIPKINIERAFIRLEGDEPLIVHKFSEKAKKEMLDKQMKKGKQAKPAKDPWMDFCESMYWLDDMPKKPTEADVKKARFGIPSLMFKACAVGAGRFVDDLPMTQIRGMFFIPGEFVEIECKDGPTMREDMVRLNGKTADIRHRGEFTNWAVTLPVEYNSSACSLEQILNLLNVGGFSQGIGEWRPERGGQFGRFHVASDEPEQKKAA